MNKVGPLRVSPDEGTRREYSSKSWTNFRAADGPPGNAERHIRGMGVMVKVGCY